MNQIFRKNILIFLQKKLWKTIVIGIVQSIIAEEA